MHNTLHMESFSDLSDVGCRSKMSQTKIRANSIAKLEIENAEEVLEFPAHATTKYLNEGAANIVYSINVPHAHSARRNCHCGKDEEDKNCINEPWHGHLLRFRKDLPTTSPTLLAHNHFLLNVAPLFPAQDLIDIRVAYIKPSGIVHRLNKGLKLAESLSSPSSQNGHQTPDSQLIKPRPSNRHGTYLADDDHALLITDMSPSATTSLFQFKPKWLFPSNSAPPGAKRCRTCALHARRNHLKALKGPSSQPKRGFCPLDLVSSDEKDILRAAPKILHVRPMGENENTDERKQMRRFVQWAKGEGGSLLRRIQRLQVQHDPTGIVHLLKAKGAAITHMASSTSKEAGEGHLADLEDKMQIAMTLRDVTLFLLMPKDEAKPLVARLGDLDLKSKGKMEVWEKIEQELIGEGWYEGTEYEHGKTRQVLDCWLWPEEWTPVEERGGLRLREVPRL